MNDAFLKFVWQYGRFDQKDLCTQTGDRIEIVSAGTPGTCTEPDFINATVRIGSDLWKGSIVVQMDGDDWYTRSYHTNRDFSNVVLNVCYRNVRPISNASGRSIPSLELNGKIPEELIGFYDDLLRSRSVLACENSFHELDRFTLNALKDRLIIERLEMKSVEIYRILEDLQWDWDKAYIKLLVKNFGGGSASVNFEQLAGLLNYDLIEEHLASTFSVEAMLLGQAGLLDREFKDSYPNLLKDEFNELRMAYELESMDPEAWHESNSRAHVPASARLAKLAWTICNDDMALHQFVDDADSWKRLEDLGHSFYWDDHADFDIESNDTIETGQFRPLAHALIINVITPAIYAYGKSMAVPDLSFRALDILDELEPEMNRKTQLFASINLNCRNAGDTQAASQLINHYCTNRLCLSCPVGRQIMDGNREELFDPLVETPDNLFN